jgi:transcription termination/antitermination protein NusG
VSENGGALSVGITQINVGLLTKTPGYFEEESWYAIRTRPRFEKKVLGELKQKDVEAFLPLSTSTRQWSDRQAKIRVPIFPGYVFVRIAASLANRVAVLRTNGVLNFVGPRDVGVPIADEEIESVRAIVDHGAPFEPYPYLHEGDKVCIRGGPLDGVTGTLEAINGDKSLVISVNLIQRSLAMRVEGFRVEPV